MDKVPFHMRGQRAADAERWGSMRPSTGQVVASALLLAFATVVRAAEDKELEAAKARLEAQVERQLEEYQKSHVQFVTAQKPGPHQAYVASCLAKILRAGNLEYPKDAKGRLYGEVRVAFSVSASGMLQKVEVDKSSGHSILDNAIVKAIHLAMPCGRFPSELGERVSTLVIVQTFSFTRADQVDAPY